MCVCVWKSVVSNSLWPYGLRTSWNSSGQNTGVGCLSLLQGTFLTQGSKPGLPHSRQILYQLRHTKSCLTPHNPMDCSTPGSPVLHYLPEFAQVHVHWVGDAVYPSHPLSSPSSPALSLSQQQGLFQMSQLFASGGQSIGASVWVLPMNVLGWLPLRMAGLISLLSKGLSRVFSSTTICKHQFLFMLIMLPSHSSHLNLPLSALPLYVTNFPFSILI